MNLSKYEALVIGVSAGGFQALQVILPQLPKDTPLSVVIVQHLHRDSSGFHVNFFHSHCPMQVKEAEEKEPLQPGIIYFAAPNYHLLIERDKTFSFSMEEKVSFSRPSIDVLFECAAATYGSKLIGMILTGANNDGANGLQLIKKHGGFVIVQDPASAETAFMPKAAIDSTEVDLIADLQGIADFLVRMPLKHLPGQSLPA